MSPEFRRLLVTAYANGCFRLTIEKYPKAKLIVLRLSEDKMQSAVNGKNVSVDLEVYP